MNNINNLLKILSLGEFPDKVKFTKLVFELQAKYNLFSYSFFRNDLDPDSIQLAEDLDSPPPKKIIHKGHEYILASSIKKQSRYSSNYNEDLDIIKNHHLLQSAKELIANNSNYWDNDRR